MLFIVRHYVFVLSILSIFYHEHLSLSEKFNDISLVFTILSDVNFFLVLRTIFSSIGCIILFSREFLGLF